MKCLSSLFLPSNHKYQFTVSSLLKPAFFFINYLLKYASVDLIKPELNPSPSIRADLKPELPSSSPPPYPPTSTTISADTLFQTTGVVLILSIPSQSSNATMSCIYNVNGTSAYSIVKVPMFNNENRHRKREPSWHCPPYVETLNIDITSSYSYYIGSELNMSNYLWGQGQNDPGVSYIIYSVISKSGAGQLDLLILDTLYKEREQSAIHHHGDSKTVIHDPPPLQSTDKKERQLIMGSSHHLPLSKFHGWTSHRRSPLPPPSWFSFIPRRKALSDLIPYLGQT
nr:hypothetical protein CFP56_06658 [Quercus suber]